MHSHRRICTNIEKPQGKINSEIPIKLSVCVFSSLDVLVALNPDGAPEPPGELLERQTPGPQPTSHKLEPIGVGAMDLCLKDNNKRSRVFYCEIRLKNPDSHSFVCSLDLSYRFQKLYIQFHNLFFPSCLISHHHSSTISGGLLFLFFFKALAIVSNQPEFTAFHA